MMEPEQFEEIIRDALAEQEPTNLRVLMPIGSFKAQDEEGADVDVVGITFTQADNENLSFVVVVELEGGELIPSLREGVWRKSA